MVNSSQQDNKDNNKQLITTNVTLLTHTAVCKNINKAKLVLHHILK
jgi:hypothetical protein